MTDALGKGLGERFLDVAVVVMVVLALLTMAVLIRRWTASESAEAEMDQAVLLPNWTEMLTGGHSEGPERAPVVIVVFSDFQCPACRAFASRMRLLRADYPDRLRVVYRHFPLGMFLHSADAAMASDCAAEQGRFRHFRDALFSDQEMIGEVPWDYFAEHAAIPNRKAFDDCLLRGNDGRAAADRRLGESIGVESTPTWILNGRKKVGTPTLATMRELVEQQLGQGKD